jgi:acetylornithine deacetylase/succinyl-diaminopimelate desuccinylase-like protein
MTSGNPDNPVNAIAPTARAHCQLRYIAGTNVDNVVPSLRKHLDDNNFNIVKIEQPPKENRGGFMASRTELDNPWVQVVKKSIEKSSGRSPAILPQMGGSICNDLFTDLLGIPAIWIPHSYSGCSQHAPDEHVILPVCRDALGLMTGLYWDLGEIKN